MSDTESSSQSDYPVVVQPQPQQPPDCGASDILSDDDGSGDIREYTGVFEGPEKTLEVCFRKIDCFSNESAITSGEMTADAAEGSPSRRIGLRQLSRDDLDRICARARCTIMSSVSNQYLDAYVLSESSLFIYPYMLVLKTCGTTTLLRCMAILINLGHKLGLEIDWVGYSRKNFNFPGDQAFPHQSFHQEIEYLYSHRSLCERLQGNGYTLGPVTDDHWFVFVADKTMRAKNDAETDRVLNIMMFDIDETVGELFYYDHYPKMKGESKEEEVKRISHEQTVTSGISELCPGAVFDPRAFEPCGYSMNAILFRSYSTIHITPEAGSSYVSFETNQKISSYHSLISNVIRTFRPKRFVMTLMADEGGMHQMKDNPLDKARIPLPNCSGGKHQSPAEGSKQEFYKRLSLASIKVEEDCCCLMGNYVLEQEKGSPRRRGQSVS